jgi:hypothetical protein
MSTKGIATWQVESEQTAVQVAGALIRRSAWFAVEPRPFNWYCFSVKVGEGHDVVFNTLRHAQRGTQ